MLPPIGSGRPSDFQSSPVEPRPSVTVYSDFVPEVALRHSFFTESDPIIEGYRRFLVHPIGTGRPTATCSAQLPLVPPSYSISPLPRCVSVDPETFELINHIVKDMEAARGPHAQPRPTHTIVTGSEGIGSSFIKLDEAQTALFQSTLALAEKCAMLRNRRDMEFIRQRTALRQMFS
ncbi:hypothetical protein HGRIS_001736 [Hohenbuehelia grisea]|uniref:Uncharacterized protein n=1 Tax=Hohenbuehelia grisea TaxID=104357 RepID=A0ABR3JII8_9AGAR